MELSRKMNVGLTREMMYSHMRVLAVADSIAKEGMLEFLDFMERDREIRDDFNVLIVKGATAENVISTTYPLQKIPSQKIHIQIDSMVETWGGDPRVRLKDLINALTSKGRQPVAELVTIQGNPQKGKQVDNNKSLKPGAVVVLQGMAVFRDQKMIGDMSLEDTRNYVWTQNLLKRTTLTIPCEKGKFFDVELYRNKTNIKARYEQGVPHIGIEVEFEGYMNGTECAMSLDQIDVYEQMQQKVARSVEERLKKTVTKVQEDYGVDIFGFGEDMYRQDTEAFKKVRGNWDEEFQKAKVDVHVDVKLRRSGIRTKSFLTELK
jgi:spore germination protein KC